MRCSRSDNWSVLVCLALAIALAGCVTRSTDHKTFQVAGWAEAGAMRSAGTDEWLCYVSAPYTTGITVEIWRSQPGYRLYFEKPEWSLQRGTVYHVDLAVDDIWFERREGLTTENAIIVPLGLDAEALGVLRRGSVLTMKAEAETFRFELQREAATLDRLESCYRRHLPQDATGYENPFASAQNPFEGGRHAHDAARHALIMTPADLEQIFHSATGMPFRVERASEFTPSADLVYILDDHLFGQYREQSVEGRKLDTVFALTLAGMQSDCPGRAVSGRYPGRENELAKVRRGFVSCEESDFFADVLILAKDFVAMVFITSSSLDDAALAEGTGTAVSSSIVP